MNRKALLGVVCLLMVAVMVGVNAAAPEKIKTDPKQQLPDPDGKSADMSKPVQVYILLGQSNMVGAGRVAGAKNGTLENAVKTKKLYPYLVDDAGQWTVRKDARYVRVAGSGTGNTWSTNPKPNWSGASLDFSANGDPAERSLWRSMPKASRPSSTAPRQASGVAASVGRRNTSTGF